MKNVTGLMVLGASDERAGKVTVKDEALTDTMRFMP
jgi:hypothetical protein